MHPYIHILGKNIPVYGLLLVISVFVAWVTLILLSMKKKRIDSGDLSLVFLIGICGGIIGATALRPAMKLIEIIISWNKFKTVAVGELLNYMTGEIVFYGGLLGGMVAVVLFCRKFKIDIIPLFDLATPPLVLAHAVGRVGCFFGGCCYGIEVPNNHPLSVVYPHASLGAPPGIPLLAVPLIEAAFLFVLFVILSFIYLRSEIDGLSSIAYLLTYPIGRFIFEFYRGDIIRGSYGLITTSQFISVGMIIFGVIYLFFVNRRKCQSKAA